MPLLPVPPSSQAEVQDLGARVLVAIAAGAGATLLVAGAVGEWGLEPTQLSRLRFGLGAVMLLAALGGRLLQRAHPTRASLLVLGSALAGTWAHMTLSGLGVHAAVLTAALMVIVLSGVLGTMSVAAVFAGLHAAALGLAFAAERAGWLPGQAALTQHGSDERLLGQLIFTAVALAAAALLARVIGASLSRALDQEQRLAELLRIGSDWTWEMDRRGLMTYISPSFETRTGRTVAEFMQGSLPGGPQVEDDDEWRAQREVMKRREPFRDRLLTYRCQDGTRLTLLASGNPVHDAQGRFVGWRGVSRDVTPERAAQQAQVRTRTLLDRLVATSPDAIALVRVADGAILLANPRFLRMAGRTEAEVIGRSALQLGLWRDPALPRQLAEELRRDGELRDRRVEVHVGDGELPQPMLLSGAAFEWDGEPVAVITTRDVAEVERARAEADAILDHASVGLALVRQGRFERVNPLFEAVLGRQPGSLAGQPTAAVLGDLALDAAAVAGQPVDVERELRRSDGTTVLVHLSARAVGAGRPQAQGMIWVVEDITERRRAERELAEAKHQAEAASEAKSAFLATMSHEIRTPLNGVLGLARLMQDPQLDEGHRRQYLQHLLDAAGQLAGIVSDVLDLSKIEAGHLQVEAVGFDLHALLREGFATFAPLGRERGLAMGCRIDAEVPVQVRGDPLRVRQIVANYLGNALKFTARGEIVLHAGAGRQGRVRLAVRDTGPGIDAALRAQLFRPFTQGDRSTTRRFGGTGLGLSICRELAARMGGEVGVDSDGTSGSCFWVELPLPSQASAAAGSGAQAAEALPLAGLQVLVAEDNAVNRLIAGAMLRRLGATVHEAEDGAQALALVERLGVSLHAVLMDLHMPVLDGLQATRRLRERPASAALPVYALSAAVLDQERQAAADAGMNGFIAKPVGQDELLRVLRGCVPPRVTLASTAG